MLMILTKGTPVREKGAAPTLPWHVVGHGRHGVICRRAEGGTVTTRCFKPDELQRADDPGCTLAGAPFVEGAQARLAVTSAPVLLRSPLE
jgi:hypothetical protein